MLYSTCLYGLLITTTLPSYIIPAGNWLSDTELMSFTENLLQQELSDLSNHVITWEQGKTAPSCLADHAPQPLLWLDKKVFTDYPTITSLVRLYDKYYPDDSHHERPYFHEDEDDDEEEESNFLDSVLETNIMNFTQSFLIEKRIFKGSKNKFKKLLKQIWFTYYRRDTAKQISSAFEHVFLGEINKDGSVLGLHNWLFFYREEALHNLNYLGWIQKIYFGKGSLLKLHYVWLGHNKPVSTMFVGTTPEFELALYTVCFLARANDRCYFSLAGNTVYIKTYMFNSNGNAYMGSAYPGI